MFDNPFDSFHKTVGKAKKEREQLDRLLTISTPGEIALVAATAGVLLLFVSWLLFGSVARSVTAEGVLAAPGEPSPADSAQLQAVVWLEKDLARQIEAGMPALLAIKMPGGETRSLEGEIATLDSVPLVDAVASLEPAPPVTLHRVHIALDESADPASLGGAECRIVIELGSLSPLAFFARRQF